MSSVVTLASRSPSSPSPSDSVKWNVPRDTQHPTLKRSPKEIRLAHQRRNTGLLPVLLILAIQVLVSAVVHLLIKLQWLVYLPVYQR